MILSPHFQPNDPTLTGKFVSNMIDTISVAKICAGNYEERFVALGHARKGKFLSCSGELVAFLDKTFCVEVDGKQYSATIRHAKCELLIDSVVCVPCNAFRPTLRTLFSKHNNRSDIPSVYTNTRFLRTPQKNARILSLRKAIRIKNRQLKQLRMRLNTIVESSGVVVPDDLRSDLEMVVENHSAVEDDEFKRIFWEQQVSLY